MFILLCISAVFITTKGAEECGILNPDAKIFPWHVGIYYNLYLAGSGSLISDKVVLTAAKEYIDKHDYLVAAGPQSYAKNEWKEPMDDKTQKSEVKEIHIVPGFKQQFRRPLYVRYYTNDMAVIIVAKPFKLNNYVRPICINFDGIFEENQLDKDAKGMAMTWNTDWNRMGTSPPMASVDLFVVVRSDCIDSNLTEFYPTFRTEKICVRYQENNTMPSLCIDENSGTGLVFPSVVNGTDRQRYYLLGVYSYPYHLEQWDFRNCYSHSLQEFTAILNHETFIRQYWNESWADPPLTGKCVLPPFPEHGSYVTNITRVNSTDGEGFVLVALTATCEDGYGVLGASSVNCYNGFWPDSFPTCVRMCQLKPHPSVEYRCLLTGAVVGSRECGGREPPGTLVSPRCREPHYYSASTLPFMRCGDDGQWDYIAKCMPECGKVTPEGKELVFGGHKVQRGELPWHVGVYSKITQPYMQICGGSLISNKLVISAAHCFWTDIDKQLPASQFAVAVGKLYRPWNDSADDAQKSDVKEIYLPERFQGASSNFQEDIAVMVVTTAFQYKTFVRPVCLSFDYNFDRLQLQSINKGKVAGWGLTAANGKASPYLRAIELPYVEVSTCIDNSPPSFREYITSDKICAGTQQTNSALCKGDSGGGLSFPASDRDTIRYYLRGVVSTAPNNDDACNTATYTSFTRIYKHEEFIKQFLKDS